MTELTVEQLIRDLNSVPAGQSLLEFSLDRVLDMSGPVLADTIRLAAIPHWFTPDILGVLQQDMEGRVALFQGIVRFSFVSIDLDNTAVYHEDVRALLLKWWQLPENLPRYRAVSRSLSEYFSEQYSVSELVKVTQAGPRITDKEHSAILRGAVESIYHRLAAEEEVGIALLTSLFRDLDYADEYAASHFLLATVVDQNPILSRKGQLWLRYLAVHKERQERAAELLEELLADSRGTAVHSAALVDWGRILADSGHPVEAEKQQKEALRPAEDANSRHTAERALGSSGPSFSDRGPSRSASGRSDQGLVRLRRNSNLYAMKFLIDLVIIQVTLALAMRLRFVLPFGHAVLPEWSGSFIYIPSLMLQVVVGALWAVSLLLGSVYTPRKAMFWIEEMQRLWLAHTVAALMLVGILYLAEKVLPQLTYVYFYVLALVLLVTYRWVVRAWFRLVRNKSQSTTRILIAGAGKVGEDLVTRLRQQHWSAYELIGFVDDAEEKQGTQIMGLPVLGRLDDASAVVQAHAVDEVIISLPLHAHVRLANLVTRLYELPIRLHVVPDYFDLAFHAATIESLAGIPLIGLRDPAIDGFQRFVKRLMDIGITSLSMIVFAPIMAVVAVAIKLDDGGPLLYRAPRIGENGRIFHMLKFRSMVVGADKLRPNPYQADEDGRVFHKRADDPRVTRVGRFIRRTSLDELPQLFNVLRGDMSLVGPRPELPWLFNEYEPWQRKRFAVPQGITGWWQINGRSENPMHLDTNQDLYYIQHYSLWLDIQILWRTVGVVLRGRGAY